jgi:putative Ig domain-containing protein
VGWNIAPALPSGLTFSPTDGSIVGTPAAAAAAAPYVVTVSNSGGQAVANLTIAVSPGPILGLGHPPKVLRLDTAHVFGQDEVGRWILWNFATGAVIASGRIHCEPNLCGAMSIVVGTAAGLELRSSADGALLASIVTAPAW